MTIKLSEFTWLEAKQLVNNNGVIVVPTAAFEQHGHHLPLDTDTRLVSFVAEESCKLAKERGIPVAVLPTVWTGFSPHHMNFAGSITLSMNTFNTVIKEICESLWHHGFRKILLLNGHGGNGPLLKSLVADLHFSSGVRVAAASYWDYVIPFIKEWRETPPGGIFHACEMETSLVLHLSEELVKQEQVKKAPWFPKSKYLTGDLTVGGTVSTSFDFAEITEEGVAGDAKSATKEKGEELFNVITNSVAEFIEEFYHWDWNNPQNI